MLEDEDTSQTLKSAHLAEWIHKTGGDPEQHHHHDPYHLDENGKETIYKRPGGGYEGVGFDHYGKDNADGFYGTAKAGADCVPKYEHIKGCVLGGNLVTHKGKTIQECKAICDGMDNCLGVEYYVRQDSTEPVNTKWEEGDCTP